MCGTSFLLLRTKVVMIKLSRQKARKHRTAPLLQSILERGLSYRSAEVESLLARVGDV